LQVWLYWFVMISKSISTFFGICWCEFYFFIALWAAWALRPNLYAEYCWSMCWRYFQMVESGHAMQECSNSAWYSFHVLNLWLLRQWTVQNTRQLLAPYLR
jgi:hypothetical protein